MTTPHSTIWSLDQPNVSKDRVKRRMSSVKMTGEQLAKELGVTPGAVSRGMDSKSWLNAKIQELAKALDVQPHDLCEQLGGVDGRNVLDRVCGPSAKSGFRLPEGCDVRMLHINGKWNMFLLAPEGIAVSDGDFVMIESSSKRGIVAGRVTQDEAPSRWIVTPGGSKRPFSVEKKTIASIRLVISALGGTWGMQ